MLILWDCRKRSRDGETIFGGYSKSYSIPSYCTSMVSDSCITMTNHSKLNTGPPTGVIRVIIALSAVFKMS